MELNSENEKVLRLVKGAYAAMSALIATGVTLVILTDAGWNVVGQVALALGAIGMLVVSIPLHMYHSARDNKEFTDRLWRTHE